MGDGGVEGRGQEERGRQGLKGDVQLTVRAHRLLSHNSIFMSNRYHRVTYLGSTWYVPARYSFSPPSGSSSSSLLIPARIVLTTVRMSSTYLNI